MKEDMLMEAEARKAMESLRGMYGDAAGDMRLDRWEGCWVVTWHGLFEWANVSPLEGGRSDGYGIPPAQDWPKGVRAEAKNGDQMILLKED